MRNARPHHPHAGCVLRFEVFDLGIGDQLVEIVFERRRVEFERFGLVPAGAFIQLTDRVVDRARHGAALDEALVGLLAVSSRWRVRVAHRAAMFAERQAMQQIIELFERAVFDADAPARIVELDGLGTFRHTETGLAFVPAEGPRVFISYVREDYEAASKLYAELEAAGLRPWLDRKKLLPGQNWRGCVERAIDTCDFFIACFSSNSVGKRGQFPYEVRYALRTAGSPWSWP